jgi:predicted Zn-dependent peptidase
MARQVSIHGRPITVEETVEHIDAVNEKSLKDVAARFLSSATTLSAVGPCSNLGDRPNFN